MFKPTPASLPPHDARLVLRQPLNLPVNFQPLNPLHFILRAAEIYPDKIAIKRLNPPFDFLLVMDISIFAGATPLVAQLLILSQSGTAPRPAIIASSRRSVYL